MDDPLDEARRLVSEGKVEFRNAALDPTRGVMDQKDAVRVLGFSHSSATGIIFQWARRDVGFGELTLSIRNGKLHVDNESMGLPFCLDIIEQALRESSAFKQ